MEQKKPYDSLIKTVGRNIQKCRKRRKITQEDMTEYGFNYRHYQRIESGNYSMNLYTLFRLAEIFETEISTFFKPHKAKKTEK